MKNPQNPYFLRPRLRPRAPSAWKLQITEDEGFQYYTDEWGITRRMPVENGHYFDLCGSPLARAESPAEVAAHPFPDSVDEARFVGLREQAEQMRAAGRAFVVGGICPGMMEMGQWLRTHENFFCDLAGNRPLAESLCDKIIELKIQYWEKALDLVGDMVDVVQEGDDYGTQRALQVSPALWREVFKPRLRQLMGQIKKRAPHAKIFFHSCGSIYDILPDLIEVGVDILNPVQVAAERMDSKLLKKDFGDALTFWGGGVDTQQVLPLGTPQQVRDEVERRIDDLAPGGGFVFAAVHNIQADAPAENLLAMRQALRDFGRYS